jgi:ribonuclease P protein component
MVHSTHRFHGRNSLRFAYQHGRMVRGDQLGLRAVRNMRQKTWRAAVVVSKKVSKSAVVRNRIRRRVFEIVRRHGARIAQPYDLVFNVYTDSLAKADQYELERIVTGLLAKADILYAPTVGESSDHAIVKNKESE